VTAAWCRVRAAKESFNRLSSVEKRFASSSPMYGSSSTVFCHSMLSRQNLSSTGLKVSRAMVMRSSLVPAQSQTCEVLHLAKSEMPLRWLEPGRWFLRRAEVLLNLFFVHSHVDVQEGDELVVAEVSDAAGTTAIVARVVELSDCREDVEQAVGERGHGGAVGALLYAWVLADAVGHCGVLLCSAKEKGSVIVVRLFAILMWAIAICVMVCALHFSRANGPPRSVPIDHLTHMCDFISRVMLIPPLSGRILFTHMGTISHFTLITRKALVVQWLERCRNTLVFGATPGKLSRIGGEITPDRDAGSSPA
jgi:hypothetical protein